MSHTKLLSNQINIKKMKWETHRVDNLTQYGANYFDDTYTARREKSTTATFLLVSNNISSFTVPF